MSGTVTVPGSGSLEETDRVAETSDQHLRNSSRTGGRSTAKSRQTVKVNFKDLGHRGGEWGEESRAGVLREVEDREATDKATEIDDLVSTRSPGIFEGVFSVKCWGSQQVLGQWGAGGSFLPLFQNVQPWRKKEKGSSRVQRSLSLLCLW